MYSVLSTHYSSTVVVYIQCTFYRMQGKIISMCFLSSNINIMFEVFMGNVDLVNMDFVYILYLKRKTETKTTSHIHVTQSIWRKEKRKIYMHFTYM